MRQMLDSCSARPGLSDRFGLMAKPVPFLAGGPLSLADSAFPSTLMYLDLDSWALGHSGTYPENIVTWRKVRLTQLVIAKVIVETRASAEVWLLKKLAYWGVL
tara:strand:- start:316 stop:624 length:309 start_codon:yes stop_codon:yes gene_type:complete